MKTKINWIKVLIFSFLVGAVIWAGKGIFKYSVFTTHDLDHHLARAFDAVVTIKEGQFPLRWAGSLNYFCGVPIYNFFYPLIYYLFVGINLLTNNIIFTLKIIDFLSLLLGTLFFYLWIKVETKKELPAIGGALTYLYAPYRFLLIFVRGSPEFLAYAILPIVLYFYSKLFNSDGKKFIVYAFLASFFGAILSISHNFTVMFLMPIILAFIIIKIYINNTLGVYKMEFKKNLWIIFSFLSSFGMGSFFIGPALLEKKFTKIGQTFIEWRDHFPTLGQLFKMKWNYFYSAPGTFNDGMSFMLGYAQWLILGISIIFIVYQLFKSKFKLWKFFKENIFIIFFFVLSVFTIYLILPWSIPVWERLKPLQEIQFSWRLLGIAVFTISALFSFLLAKINSKFIYLVIFAVVSALTIIGTRNFMLPQPVSSEDLYKYYDFEKLHYHRYSTTTLGDDVVAPGSPGACWFDVPLIATDKERLDFSVIEKGNTYGFVRFSLPQKPIGTKLIMGLGYFPGNYNFVVNGVKTNYSNCDGRACFPVNSLRSGENTISWKVGQSPIESFFNYFTLTFFAIWLAILLVQFAGTSKDKNKNFYTVLLILVFGIFMFFRSHNLNGRIIFGWDQERDATTAISILVGKLTLLGPRVQGPTGFFLPPYFFYLITPFYKFVSNNPVAIINFVIFWSILFFTISYLVISKIFNKWTALVFLSLWAVNPLAIAMDTIAWNPIVIPTFFLVLIYQYYLCLKDVNKSKIFLLGLIFGFGVSFHTQFIFTFLLFTPLIIEIFKRKNFLVFGHLILGSVIPFIPILLFDLRHNFLNIKQLLGYSLNGGALENRALPVWANVSSFVTGLHATPAIGLIFYTLILIGLLLVISKIKDEIQKKIFVGLTYVWGFSLPLFYIILKNPSEYYYNYLFVIAFILVAYIATIKKYFGIILISIAVLFFSLKSIPLLHDSKFSLKEKTEAVVFVKQVTQKGTPFNISFDVPANEDSGFRYLLNYYDVKYSGDPRDSLIEFVIPPNRKPTAFVFGSIGIYIPESWIQDNWLK
ncbi:MAG TPA: glycosyltransferase family 39 protein [Patescibacteria group bacterium]|nr:glycosyltransferase family 39 protein [Patescibacteria group bacterium]